MVPGMNGAAPREGEHRRFRWPGCVPAELRDSRREHAPASRGPNGTSRHLPNLVSRMTSTRRSRSTSPGAAGRPRRRAGRARRAARRWSRRSGRAGAPCADLAARPRPRAAGGRAAGRTGTAGAVAVSRRGRSRTGEAVVSPGCTIQSNRRRSTPEQVVVAARPAPGARAARKRRARRGSRRQARVEPLLDEVAVEQAKCLLLGVEAAAQGTLVGEEAPDRLGQRAAEAAPTGLIGSASPSPRATSRSASTATLA